MNFGGGKKPKLQRLDNGLNTFSPLNTTGLNGNSKRLGSSYSASNETPLKRASIASTSDASTSQASTCSLTALKLENAKLKIDMCALKSDYDYVSKLLAQKTDESKNLNTQLLEIQTEKRNLQVQLNNEIKNWKKPVTPTFDLRDKQEIARLKRELYDKRDKMKSDNSYYRDKVDKKEKQINELKFDNRNMANKLVELESKHNEKINDLGKQLSEERQKLNKIRSMYDEQIVKSHTAISDLKIMVNSQVLDLKKHTEEFMLKNKRLEIELAKVKQTLDTSENEKISTSGKIQSLESDLKNQELNKNIELHNIRELNQQLMEEKKKVRTELSIALNDINNLRNKNEVLTKQHQELNDSNMGLIDEKAKLMDQIKVKDEEIENLRSNASSSSELAAALADKQRIEKLLEKRKEKNRLLKKQKMELEKKNIMNLKMLRDMDEMKRIVEAARNEKDSYNLKITNLDSQLNFVKHEKLKVEDSYSTVCQQLNNQKKDFEKLTSEKEDCEQQFQDLRKQNASLMVRIANLEKSRNELLLEKERIEESSSLEENSQKEKQLQEQLNERLKVQKSLERTISKLTAENQQLKKQAHQHMPFYTNFAFAPPPPNYYPPPVPTPPFFIHGPSSRAQGGYKR